MIDLYAWIAVYIFGGIALTWAVNSAHRSQFGENIKGVALKRGIFFVAFWPITVCVMLFPPTRRYVETGSFKR